MIALSRTTTKLSLKKNILTVPTQLKFNDGEVGSQSQVIPPDQYADHSQYIGLNMNGQQVTRVESWSNIIIMISTDPESCFEYEYDYYNGDTHRVRNFLYNSRE